MHMVIPPTSPEHVPTARQQYPESSMADIEIASHHMPDQQCLMQAEVAHNPPTLDSLYLKRKRSNSTVIDVEDVIMKLRGSHRMGEKERLLALRGQAAIDVLDTLQLVGQAILCSDNNIHECSRYQWLDANTCHDHRRRVLKLLMDIASSSNELPASLFIRDVHLDSQVPESFGAYADIFRGTLRGQHVAVKRLSINESGKTRYNIHRVSCLRSYQPMPMTYFTLKKFCKEGLTWRQLIHPNILPFLGVDGQTFSDIQMLGMVSPWMERGTLMQYMRSEEYDPVIHRHALVCIHCCILIITLIRLRLRR
jgi:hypothetical protein